MLCYYFILFLSIIEYSTAQIPRECANNFTLKTGICCPISKFNKHICGFPERGSCDVVRVYEEEVERFGFDDVRFEWPSSWFKKLCKCNGNYFGSSCDECWYGWSGENCSQSHRIVRRDVLSYNKTERAQLVNVIKSMREEPCEYLLVKEAYRDTEEMLVPANIHEVIVNIHFFAQRQIITQTAEMCEEVPFLDFAHANIGFLTFHRHFMMRWERWTSDMAKRKYGIENFSFPYWDWTDKTTCEVCFDDLIGAQGEISVEGSYYLSTGSPFHSWRVYCDLFSPKDDLSVNNCAPCSSSSQSSKLTRKVSASLLPVSEHILYTLARPCFAPLFYDPTEKSQCPAFSKALEGTCGRERWKLKNTMHNAVHSAVLGPFSDTATSPNDPLFILHHTQVDRLFQRWWLSHSDAARQYPRSMTPGHCYLCNQVGFIPAVNHKRFFADTRDLGYDYDSLIFGGQ